MKTKASNALCVYIMPQTCQVVMLLLLSIFTTENATQGI